MTMLLSVLIFVFGACVGSFLNVAILRLPLGQKLNGRSHCPSCGRQLFWWELFPLASFVLLGGKCSSCKIKISSRYFIIELVAALLFAGSYLYLSPTGLAGYIMLAKYWFAAAVMIVVFVVDLEHYLILDRVVFPAVTVLALFNLALDFVQHRNLWSLSAGFSGGLVAAVLAALPFFLIWYFSKGKYMGFGDIKMILLMGIMLGWPVVFVSLFVAVILGGVVSVYLLMATSKTMKSQLPFGTFLSLSAVFCLFFGDKLLLWYLSFLGF
ncbi:MAG: prepilin peptidase [Candidatus Doudnabacteria bacterium]|nr:prepilin peptidase [Candidatus Doudnabacteria bacterium]